MGTQINKIPPGANCYLWDPVDETPESIYVFFWEILKGDRGLARIPPNLHIFKLDQVDGNACLWRYENAAFGWFVEVGIDGMNTWLWLRDSELPAKYYFADHKAVSPPAEYELFTNDYNAPFNNWGYDGFGSIFWMDAIIDLVEAFGLEWTSDLMLEMSADDAQTLIVKLCSLQAVTNIKFKIQ